MSDQIAQPKDQDLRAAELVLGLLSGEDLVAALRLRLSDRDFADAVLKWEERFAPLFDQYQSVSPPAELWDKIDALLNNPDWSRGNKPVTDIAAANNGAKVWKISALVSGAVAAGLALILVLNPIATEVDTSPINPAQQIATQQVIASLSGDSSDLSAATRYDPVSGEMNVRTSGVEVGNLIPELWVVPADGTPRAIGAMPVNDDGTILVAPELRKLIDDGALLAVTMEDPTVSDRSEPTTPILATGTLAKI